MQTVETFIQERGALNSSKQDLFERNEFENVDPNLADESSCSSRSRRTPRSLKGVRSCAPPEAEIKFDGWLDFSVKQALDEPA